MSDRDLTAWLAMRAPRPPEALARALAQAVAEPPAEPVAEPPADLTLAAGAALRRALALGDARPAAWELLTADALLTYAIEQAAEAGAEPLARLLGELTPDRVARLAGVSL